MKRLLTIILLCAAFVAGYWVGQRPGSPDLAATARRVQPAVDRAADRISDLLRPADARAPEQASVYVPPRDAR